MMMPCSNLKPRAVVPFLKSKSPFGASPDFLRSTQNVNGFATGAIANPAGSHPLRSHSSKPRSSSSTSKRPLANLLGSDRKVMSMTHAISTKSLERRRKFTAEQERAAPLEQGG